IKVVQTGAALQTKRVGFTYNAVGQLLTLTRATDNPVSQLVATTTYGYDAVNRLTSLAHTQSATTLASYTIGYDAAARVTTRTDSDGTTTYLYNALGELGAVSSTSTPVPPESFAYDAAGNRVGTGSAGAVIGTGNRLLNDGTYSYQYD